MAEEPGDVAVAADPWPHALSGLRHTDQLRAILAGMPRPAGREVDWAERIEFVQSHPADDGFEQAALPAAMAYEPGDVEADHFEVNGSEPAPHTVRHEPLDDARLRAPVTSEPVMSVPFDAVVQPVMSVPMAPQPILWVPTSAFEGAPPPAVAPVAVTPVPVAVAPPPATMPAPDPRFVPIPATFSLSDPSGPTTGWTMRLGFGDPQPIPNPIPAAESMTFANRRRRWRRAVAVVVVVVVLAAAAAAGWLVWRHRTAGHHPPAAAAVSLRVNQSAVPPAS